jgi:hypothetical protein
VRHGRHPLRRNRHLRHVVGVISHGNSCHLRGRRRSRCSTKRSTRPRAATCAAPVQRGPGAAHEASWLRFRPSTLRLARRRA